MSDNTLITGFTGPDGNGVYTKNIGTVGINNVLDNLHSLKLATGTTCADGNYYYSDPNFYVKPVTNIDDIRIITGGSTMYHANYNRGSFVTYNGLHFIGVCAYAIPGGAYSYSDITFFDCDFTDNNWVALIFYSNTDNQHTTNITIDSCLFQYNYNNIYFVTDDHVGAYHDNVLIKNSRFLNTHEYYGTSYTHSPPTSDDWDGITCQSLKNSIIENNEISGHCERAAGIQVWQSSYVAGVNNIIRGNYIHDCYGVGILYGGQDSGTCNVKIYNNIIVNAGDSAYTGCYGAIAIPKPQTSTQPSEVYNNTIVNCTTGIYVTYADYVTVKNNIIYNSANYHVQTGNVSHNIFDYNDYYPAVGDVFKYDGNAVPWSTWKTDISGDANSKILDPLFVNTSGLFNEATDFKLQSTSPCLGAGTNAGLTTDYEGRPIYNTETHGNSMGAYGWAPTVTRQLP